MLATTASVRVSFRTHGVRRGLDRAYSRAHEVNIFYPPALAPKHSQASKALNRVNDIKRVKEERQTLSRPTVSKERPGGVLLSQRDNTALSTPAGDTPHQLLRATKALSPNLTRLLPATLQKYTLHNKVAIVTGGARGLGLNMAQGLVECGVKALAIFDIQPELGIATTTALQRATGIPVKYFNANVCDEPSLAEAVDQVVQSFGSVDILINAAGVAFSNIKAEEYDSEDFCRTIDINTNGTFRVAKACGRHMIKSGRGGSIIFIASMSGIIVNWPQEQCAYNASKAAVIHLSKSLAAEWAKHGVRVNSISPGYMDTALNKVPALDAQKQVWTSRTPQQRLGRVDELNNLAVFMASDASSFMTGSNVVIDGGYSIY